MLFACGRVCMSRGNKVLLKGIVLDTTTGNHNCHLLLNSFQIGSHFRLFEDLKAMDKPLLQQVSPLTSRRTLSVDRKDGIYSWIIALGLCLINCIDDGVLKGFGVLLNPLSLQYGVATWVIGTTLALMGFVGNITGNLFALFLFIRPIKIVSKCIFTQCHLIVLSSS